MQECEHHCVAIATLPPERNTHLSACIASLTLFSCSFLRSSTRRLCSSCSSPSSAAFLVPWRAAALAAAFSCSSFSLDIS